MTCWILMGFKLATFTVCFFYISHFQAACSSFFFISPSLPLFRQPLKFFVIACCLVIQGRRIFGLLFFFFCRTISFGNVPRIKIQNGVSLQMSFAFWTKRRRKYESRASSHEKSLVRMSFFFFFATAKNT